MKKRLILLSGPSCVGKGPLKAAIDRFFPQIRYSTIPVIKSFESKLKRPNPDEEKIWGDKEYFRAAADLNKLKSDDSYLVGECRTWPQALDLNKVDQIDADVVFIEAYHTLGSQLKQSKRLAGMDVTSVFVSPVSMLDILDLKRCGVNLSQYLNNLMLAKQIARNRFRGNALTQEIANDLAARAQDAYAELAVAHKYSIVIVNHDGEGSPNWNMSPNSTFISKPEGDALRAATALAAILAGDASPPQTEVWSKQVLCNSPPTFGTNEPDQRHKRKICFAASLPGEPGGGDIDSDFYSDRDFYGTVDEALAEARRIRSEVYDGDYVFWLE